MKVKSQSEVAQSCLTPSDPMACSLPSSSVHGIFQARVLEWGAIAFSDRCGYIFSKLIKATNKTSSDHGSYLNQTSLKNLKKKEKNKIMILHVCEKGRGQEGGLKKISF